MLFYDLQCHKIANYVWIPEGGGAASEVVSFSMI